MAQLKEGKKTLSQEAAISQKVSLSVIFWAAYYDDREAGWMCWKMSSKWLLEENVNRNIDGLWVEDGWMDGWMP